MKTKKGKKEIERKGKREKRRDCGIVKKIILWISVLVFAFCMGVMIPKAVAQATTPAPHFTINPGTSIADIQNFINNAPANTQRIIAVNGDHFNGLAGAAGTITIPANRDIVIATQGTNLATGVGPAPARMVRQAGGDHPQNGRHFVVTGTNARLTMVNLILCGVDAEGATVLYRGGVDIRTGGTFDFRSGEIRNNRGARGGGVNVGPQGNFTTRSVPSIAGEAVIRNNKAVPEGQFHGNGGGAYIWQTALTVTFGSGTRITNNHANSGYYIQNSGAGGGHNTGNGGGLYSHRSLTLGTGVEISYNRTTRNTTGIGADGGGIYFRAHGSGTVLTINGAIIRDNRAQRNGGGVALSGAAHHGQMVLSSGEIINNEAYNPTQGIAASGGGVAMVGTQVTSFNMSGGRVAGNNARSHGGGVYIFSPGGVGTLRNEFTLTGGYVENNTIGTPQIVMNASGFGGGVSIRGGGARFTLDGGTIRGNYIRRPGLNAQGNPADLPGWGSAVHVVANGHMIITDGMIGGVETEHANVGGSVIYNGGRIEMSGGIIRGNRSVISGWGTVTNTGSASGAFGGFFMSDGLIYRNEVAGNGGGVNNVGRFEMSGTAVISRNHANGGIGGGGVHNVGQFEMSGNAVISHNTAHNNGGGVSTALSADQAAVAANGVTMSGNARIYGNIARQTARGTLVGPIPAPVFAGGGGVFVTTYGRFTMNGGTIGGDAPGMANQAERALAAGYLAGGGGVGLTGNASFVMTNGRIIGNVSATDGGGVYLNGAATMSMTGGWIEHNRSTGTGGGIATGHTVDTTGSVTINGGAVNENRSHRGGGGGVSLRNGTLNLITGEISENRAFHTGGGIVIGYPGGGVRVSGEGSFSMSGGEISENIIIGNGGGVYLGDGEPTFTMTGGTIRDNGFPYLLAGGYGVLNAQRGGGVAVDEGTFDLRGGTITNNWAGLSGGGIHMGGTGILQTNQISAPVLVTNNVANASGGGVTLASSAPAASNTLNVTSQVQITGNSATSRGGGVYMNHANARLNITGGQINNNGHLRTIVVNAGTWPVATVNGGGVFMNFGQTTMSSGQINSNRASNNGGGLWVGEDASFSASGTSAITGNTAVDGDGGGIFSDDHTYELTLPLGSYPNLTIAASVTFNNNTASRTSTPPLNPGPPYTNIAATVSTSIYNHPLNNRDINFWATGYLSVLAPPTLSFGTHPLVSGSFSQQAISGWQAPVLPPGAATPLIVRDTRSVRTPWTLQARMTTPLTHSVNGHVIGGVAGGAVRYRNDVGTEFNISGASPVAIHSRNTFPGGGGVLDTNITELHQWGNVNRGLMLELDHMLMRARPGAYVGTVTWTLVNGP